MNFQSKEAGLAGRTDPQAFEVVDRATVSAAVFLARAVVRGWKLIAAFTFVGAVVALIVAYTTTPIYQSSVTIVPSEDLSGKGIGGLSSIASQLSDFGDLAGLSSGSPALLQALASLRSRANTVAFMQRYGILQQMYPEAWDPATKSWRPPTEWAKFVASLTGKTLGATQEPSYGAAYERFDKLRTIEIQKAIGTVVVTIEWRDPNQAAAWANQLVKSTDDALRQTALTESQHNLAYLKGQAAESSLSDLRQSIYLLAAKELRRSMMASVGSNYSLKVLDPAVPADKRSWPARTFLLILGILGGSLLGALVAIMRGYIAAIRGVAQM